MKKDFNDFRFEGLNYRDRSNKYFTMDRVNADETKVVVRIAEDQVIPTKYGYALILDGSHVVFLKSWQVDINYFGCEVLLTKEYFNVKEWGDFPDYDGNEHNQNWSTWVEAAKAQDAYVDADGDHLTSVKWSK